MNSIVNQVKWIEDHVSWAHIITELIGRSGLQPSKLTNKTPGCSLWLDVCCKARITPTPTWLTTPFPSILRKRSSSNSIAIGIQKGSLPAHGGLGNGSSHTSPSLSL